MYFSGNPAGIDYILKLSQGYRLIKLVFLQRYNDVNYITKCCYATKNEKRNVITINSFCKNFEVIYNIKYDDL